MGTRALQVLNYRLTESVTKLHEGLSKLVRPSLLGSSLLKLC
jgi:hypothetical protein